MSQPISTYDDDALIELLRSGNVRAFETLYDRYVSLLFNYVDSRIRAKEDSKEIVQDIFEWVWSNRESITINSSVRSYFFGAAKHQILNYIRSSKIQEKYISHFNHFVVQRHDNSTEDMLELADLENSIEESISKLPPKCQTIFRMSRMEHLSIQEIAERMNVSPRTVENNLSLALKHLRENLKGVMVWVMFFWGAS